MICFTYYQFQYMNIIRGDFLTYRLPKALRVFSSLCTFQSSAPSSGVVRVFLFCITYYLHAHRYIVHIICNLLFTVHIMKYQYRDGWQWVASAR